MTKNDLKYLKQWFADYTKRFYSSIHNDQRNIMLKIEHSHNVSKNIIEIASYLKLSDHELSLAEAIALFHDVGRFSQYARYRTFRDAGSKNHGLLGAQILVNENVLRNLSDDEQELIIQVVKFHNAYAIPTVLKGDMVLFLKLIRDADKIDIFRVFIKYYESAAEDRATATAFGVPDTPEYSRVMLSCIFNKQVASYSDIKNENDFKLMKLSWIYDMHFKESLKLLQTRDSVNRIIRKLPQTGEISAAMKILRQYISKRLRNGSCG